VPDAPKGLEGALAAAAGRRGAPPVHLWRPAHCGEIDIRIRRDGVWMHEGSPIGRDALVRLFASVLRKDPDGFHLVTPVEKMKIAVEDAPFVAVRVDRAGPDLIFTTNVGDEVALGPDHALRLDTDAATGAPRPYIHVRRGLEALISRPVFYELVELAETREGPLGPRLVLASGGAAFDLGAADQEA
jgi:hypothetical protein